MKIRSGDVSSLGFGLTFKHIRKRKWQVKRSNVTVCAIEGGKLSVFRVAAQNADTFAYIRLVARIKILKIKRVGVKPIEVGGKLRVDSEPLKRLNHNGDDIVGFADAKIVISCGKAKVSDGFCAVNIILCFVLFGLDLCCALNTKRLVNIGHIKAKSAKLFKRSNFNVKVAVKVTIGLKIFIVYVSIGGFKIIF